MQHRCNEVCNPQVEAQVLMAIDPGVSTGIAFAISPRDDTTEWQYSTATCTNPEQLWEFIEPPVTHVIIERFAAQLIDKYGLHTVDVVGGAKALAWKHNMSWTIQTPQNRYPYLKLAKSLVTRKGHTRHEVDAMAQLLCYMYRQGYITSIGVKP